MRLTMNREVLMISAVAASGGPRDCSPHVPRAPKQFAESENVAERTRDAEGHAVLGLTKRVSA